MAAQQYRPFPLRFKLENVILNNISDETISFVLNNQKQLRTDIIIDPNKGVIHITPGFNWTEMAEYSIVFSKMLQFHSGRLLLKNYAVPFQIKDGIFYSRNGRNAVRGGDLFVPENIFRHDKLISARFDESKNWVYLDYLDD